MRGWAGWVGRPVVVSLVGVVLVVVPVAPVGADDSAPLWTVAPSGPLQWVGSSPSGSWRIGSPNYRIDASGGVSTWGPNAPGGTCGGGGYTVLDDGQVVWVGVSKPNRYCGGLVSSRYGGGSWSSLSSVGANETILMVTALASGGVAVVTDSGKVYRSNSAVTSWSLDGQFSSGLGCGASGCTVRVFGDVIHVVKSTTPVTYRRYSLVSHGEVPVVSAPDSPASLLRWQLLSASADGEHLVWVGHRMSSWTANPTALWMWESTDAGHSWSSTASGEQFPVGVSDGVEWFPYLFSSGSLGQLLFSVSRVDGVYRLNVTLGRDIGTTQTYRTSREFGANGEWVPWEDLSQPGPTQNKVWFPALASGGPTLDIDVIGVASAGVDKVFWWREAGTPLADPTIPVVDESDHQVGPVELHGTSQDRAPRVFRPVSSFGRIRAGAMYEADDASMSVLTQGPGEEGEWRRIPASGGGLNAVAVNDRGEVFAAHRSGAGQIPYLRRFDGRRWTGGSWINSVANVDIAAMLATSDRLVAVNTEGKVSTADPDGFVWTQHSVPTIGSLSEASVSTDGGYLYRRSGSGFTAHDLSQPGAAAPAVSSTIPLPANLIDTRVVVPHWESASPLEVWVVSWTASSVHVTQSTDRGATWSTLNDLGAPAGLATAAEVAFADDGRVYLFWAEGSGATKTIRRASHELCVAPASCGGWDGVVDKGTVSGDKVTLRATLGEGSPTHEPPDVFAWAWTSLADIGALWHFGRAANFAYDDDVRQYQGTRPGVHPFGDPVDPATGNFYDSWTDLAGLGGVFGLDVGRAYNSLSSEPSVLGPGWRSAFSQTAAPNSAGDLEVRLEDGRMVVFGAIPGGWGPASEFNGAAYTEGDGSYRVEFPDATIWRFDLAGRIEALESWDGQSVTIARGAAGRVETATSSLGPTLTFAYHATTGRLLSVTSSDGRTVSYTYDTWSGFLKTFTDPAGVVTSYGTDNIGRVTTITDATGVVAVSNTFDGAGRVTQQVTPTGTVSFSYTLDRTTDITLSIPGGGSETLAYAHDAKARPVEIEDPFGEVSERSFDPVTGWPTSGETRAGKLTLSEYDAQGRPTEITDPAEGTTTYTYDGAGRVTAVESPTSGTTTLTYEAFAGDPNRIPRTITDELNHTTTNQVTNGLIDWTEDADGVRTTFGYDAMRRLRSSTDELGRATEFDYDAAGRLNWTETPEGRVTTTVFDDAGRTLSSTTAAQDPTAAATTSYSYDAAGRVTTVTDPTGAVTRNTYYPATGLLWKVEAPGDTPGTFQPPTVYTYNSLGELLTVTDPTGVATGSTPGAFRRTAEAKDSANRVTTMSYDEDGRIETVTSPATGENTTVRDPVTDQVRDLEDGLERVIRYDYQPNGLVAAQTAAYGTPDAATTSYTYDALGRVRRTTDPEGRWTETYYTPAGRVDYTIDAAGETTDLNYDAAGQLDSVEDPAGQDTVYSYWPDGPVHTVTTPEGRVTTTSYDPAGRVHTVTDPAGVTTTNTWSKRGELLGESITGRGTAEWRYWPDGTLDWVEDRLDNRTTYDFDTAGRLLSRGTPFGTETWGYHPTTGELQSHTPVPVPGSPSGTETWTYDSAGRIETHTDGSGRVRTNTWDVAGQLDVVEFDDGTDSFTYDYTYNHRGQITAIDAPDGTHPRGYNTAGQLTLSSTPDGRVTRWGYDSAGRRASMTTPDGTELLYSYDTRSRLTSIRPAATLADTFTQPAADSAVDPAKWETATTGDGIVGVVDNTLRLGTTDTASTAAITAQTPPVTDIDLVVDVTPGDTDPANRAVLQLDLRADSTAGDAYRLTIPTDSTTATLTVLDNGTPTTLGSLTVPATTSRIRLRAVGSTITARAWDPTEAEPASWDLTVTDTAVNAPGAVTIRAERDTGGPNHYTLDNVAVTHNPTIPQPDIATYAYNNDHQLTGETLPDGGRTWSYNPTTGQLASMAQNLPGSVRTTTLGFDTAGAINAETTTGEDPITYTYDDAGQLATRAQSGVTTTYTYDRGRLASEQTGANPPKTYTYNNRSQLTGTTEGTVTRTIGYDGAGRRTNETCNICTSYTYTYDPAGRLTESDDSTTLQTRAYTPDGLIHHVTYTGGATSNTIIDWDINSAVPQMNTWQSTNDPTTLVHGPGGWVATRRDTTNTAIGLDVHGSATTTTGQGAGFAAGYDPWGTPTGTAPAKPALGYRGELTLTQLTNLRARDYQVPDRQFATTDPLPDIPGTPTQGNPYHYTNNNPLNLVDPLGLTPGGPGAGVDDDSLNHLKSDWDNLIPGIGSGVIDFLNGLNPLEIVRGLGSMIGDALDECWPWDLVCLAGYVKTMVVDAFTEIRSNLETVINEGASMRNVLELLSPFFGIDMAACEREGWQYCIAKAATPVLLGAALTGGAALADRIGDISSALRNTHLDRWNNHRGQRGAIGSGSATNSADDAARFAVDSAGNATLRARGQSGWVDVSEHAAERMTQRGISIEALDTTLTQQPFQYWHEGIWKTGYYNATTKVFAGTVNDTVTTVIGRASQNYINNLKAATPP